MEIDGIKIPEEWIKLLNVFKERDPEAVIAGGAIRDLFYGVAPKDIDIFASWIPGDWHYDGPPFEYDGMKYVNAVVSARNVSSIPLNIIVVQSQPPVPLMDLLESFDFGFCQIAFDGKQIIQSPAFGWDFKHSVITLRHTDRYQRSMERWMRFRSRYSMPLIIPELETK